MSRKNVIRTSGRVASGAAKAMKQLGIDPRLKRIVAAALVNRKKRT